jgi:protein TonB
MPLDRCLLPLAMGAAALAAGCASTTRLPSDHAGAEATAPAAEVGAAPAAEVRAAPALPAVTLDRYKQQVARKIVASHPASFEGDLPPILKSIVVLDITVDREGKLVRTVVRRSNGYKELEQTALESVHKAAPLPAPSLAVHRGGATVSYLETWLFRADGRFQIRSLAEPQKVAAGPDSK